MSYDGSKREYLYSIYLKKNPMELARKIGLELNEEDIMLERVYKNERYKRRVDISAICKSRRLFLEIQLSKSDAKHYNQIVELINLVNQESTVIIWVATGFIVEHMTKLMQLVLLDSKNIELVFLKLNDEVIQPIEEINRCEESKQIEMLGKLNNIKTHFELINVMKNFNSIQVNEVKYNSLKEKYTYKQKILIKIIELLRQDCKEQANVYQYKDVSRNCFGIGSGVGGLDFRVMIDRKNRIGVALIFSNVKTKSIYYKLKAKREEIDDEFDYMLTWNDKFEQISTFISIGWFADKEKMVLIFERIVKKYLYGFDKFLKEIVE